MTSEIVPAFRATARSSTTAACASPAGGLSYGVVMFPAVLIAASCWSCVMSFSVSTAWR